MQKVPLIRSIYIPVRQVVNYLFDTEQPRFSRVVAVEYPRRGIWTLAFVTGEGMSDLEKITGEPMLTILFPTCPVPSPAIPRFCLVARSLTCQSPSSKPRSISSVLES